MKEIESSTARKPRVQSTFLDTFHSYTVTIYQIAARNYSKRNIEWRKFRNATGALLVESLDPKVPFLDGSGQQDGLQFHAGIQVLLSGMALSYALGIASAWLSITKMTGKVDKIRLTPLSHSASESTVDNRFYCCKMLLNNNRDSDLCFIWLREDAQNLGWYYHGSEALSIPCSSMCSLSSDHSCLNNCIINGISQVGIFLDSGWNLDKSGRRSWAVYTMRRHKEKDHGMCWHVLCRCWLKTITKKWIFHLIFPRNLSYMEQRHEINWYSYHHQICVIKS